MLIWGLLSNGPNYVSGMLSVRLVAVKAALHFLLCYSVCYHLCPRTPSPQLSAGPAYQRETMCLRTYSSESPKPCQTTVAANSWDKCVEVTTMILVSWHETLNPGFGPSFCSLPPLRICSSLPSTYACSVQVSRPS